MDNFGISTETYKKIANVQTLWSTPPPPKKSNNNNNVTKSESGETIPTTSKPKKGYQLFSGREEWSSTKTPGSHSPH